jgi:hypothetical protein
MNAPRRPCGLGIESIVQLIGERKLQQPFLCEIEKVKIPDAA